ncbi:monovalent cation/H(+) antiporter subunit G [Algicola sagamiensis]|uniref:monovalent cation/H(+) antiporter subunit G n=1 Tax=Algicola sagamiensis TaxID=163869 RepID=UPI00035C5D75|nr:monovalent cation/H(+) antiporter subunit G [Algicola sagamiensis]
MNSFLDCFTILMVSIGLIFFFAGSVGLWRFPDTFSRLHALTKADNLGLGFIVIGLFPQTSHVIDAIQLILIWVVAMLSGAVSSYLLARNTQMQWQHKPQHPISKEKA